MILADDYIINSRRFPEEILSGSDLFPRQADRQGGRPEWSVSAKPFAASQGGGNGEGGVSDFARKRVCAGKSFAGFSRAISISPPQRPTLANGKGGGGAKRETGIACLSFYGFLTRKMQTPNPHPPSPSDPNPAKRIGSEGEEIPTRVQFSAKPETERWWEFLGWSKRPLSDLPLNVIFLA